MLYLDKFELIQIRRVWFEDNCLFEDKFRFILIKFGYEMFVLNPAHRFVHQLFINS